MRAGADLVRTSDERDLLFVLRQTGKVKRRQEVVLSDVRVSSQERSGVLRWDRRKERRRREGVHDCRRECPDKLLDRGRERSRMVDAGHIVRRRGLLQRGWWDGPHQVRQLGLGDEEVRRGFVRQRRPILEDQEEVGRRNFASRQVVEIRFL